MPLRLPKPAWRRADAASLRMHDLLQKMAMAPPADLGTRIDRYRCCLPALAEFSI
jgi:hypothetical protein